MSNRNSKKFKIVIFGATGDLTKKKLIPSLYKLFEKKEIDQSIPIICIARKQLRDEEFIRHLDLKNNLENINKETLKKFLKQIYYISFDFNKVSSDCNNLKKSVDEINKKYKCKVNTIFYLATPAQTFEPIAKIIKESGFLSSGGFKRIAFEKPFGTNFKSAKYLNKFLLRNFEEDEIYRIDHYLGKTLVQDILVFRFANPLFEQIWTNKFIDHFQITISEEIGIGARGRYYDNFGAVKDMLQNHLLQLLSLVAMEMPKSTNAEDIRDQKVRVLRSIKDPESSDLVLGQYESYKDEIDVSNNSKTETYVFNKIYINSSRWKGVPFYLKTGKRLKSSYSEINVVLKDISKVLFVQKNKKDIAHNVITIRIQPDSGMAVTFNTKYPDSEMRITPITMDFCYKCKFGMNTPEAYEAIFTGIMNGDKTMFTRWDGVEASWKYIDKVEKLGKKIYLYDNESLGPKESEKLLRNDNRISIEGQS